MKPQHAWEISPRSRLRSFGCNYLKGAIKTIGAGDGESSVLLAAVTKDGVGLFAWSEATLTLMTTISNHGDGDEGETVHDLAWSPPHVGSGDLLAIATARAISIHRVMSGALGGMPGSVTCQIVHKIQLPRPGHPISSVEWSPSAIPSLYIFSSAAVTMVLTLPRGGSKDGVSHSFSEVQGKRGAGCVDAMGFVWTSRDTLAWGQGANVLRSSTLLGDCVAENVIVASLAACRGSSACLAATIVTPPPAAPMSMSVEDHRQHILLPGQGPGTNGRDNPNRILISEISTSTTTMSTESATLDAPIALQESQFLMQTQTAPGAFPHVLPGTTLLEALQPPLDVRVPPLARCGGDVMMLLRSSDGAGRKVSLVSNSAFGVLQGRMDLSSLWVNTCATGDSYCYYSLASSVASTSVLVCSFSPDSTTEGEVKFFECVLPESSRCRGLVLRPPIHEGSPPMLLVLAATKADPSTAPLASVSSSSVGSLVLLQYSLSMSSQGLVSSLSSARSSVSAVSLCDGSAGMAGVQPPSSLCALSACLARIEEKLDDQSRILIELSTKMDHLVVRVDGLEAHSQRK